MRLRRDKTIHPFTALRLMVTVCAAVFVLCAALWAQSLSPDSTKLIPVKTDPPVYPLDAQKQGIQGEVWVRIFVDETGGVTKVELIRGNPILTKAALEAARKWKFQPFISNGKPSKVTAEMPVDFAFRDKIMEKGVSADATASIDARTAQPHRGASSASGINPQAPMRVSRGVAESLLVHQVAPVYPPAAREHHVEGMVVLKALIGRDGRIRDLNAVSGPKELIPAAIGAVEQWRYQPYLVENQPMEVETQITVNFTLPPF